MMANGRLVGIFVAPQAGAPMEEVTSVIADSGNGLIGDRYCDGDGSWNKGAPGKRQATFINSAFFPGSGFEFKDSRRNFVTDGIELMLLIGKQFYVGEVLFSGVKYCDPCMRPTQLSGKEQSFKDAFHDRGGLIADILTSGTIYQGNEIVPVAKK